MASKAFKILILASLLITLMAISVMASKSPTEIRIIDPVTIKVMDYAFPDEGDFTVTSQPQTPLDRSSSTVGFGWSAGTTYYDYQHNASMHRQINWGSSASCPWTAHFTWMMLPSGVLADREQVYQGWDGAGGSAVGYYADMQSPGDYAGYGSLAITDDNRFVIGVHHLPDQGVYRSTAFYQSNCNVPFHSPFMIVTDSLNDLGSTCIGPTDYVIWPSIAVQNPPDGDRVLHLIGGASCGGSGASAFLYWQAVGTEGDANSWNQGHVIDTIHNGEAYDISTDENGNVGIAWVGRVSANLSACDTCSVNAESAEGIGFDRSYSDMYMQVNRNFGRGAMGDLFDGTTNWWENRVNLTKLNDTATTEGMYPQADIISMWDASENFHIAWIAMPSTPTLQDYVYQSRVFHWGENLGYTTRATDGAVIALIRTVSTAQWDPEFCNPGAFNQNQAKLSLTQCDNKYYVTWVELNSPLTTGNENHDDCAERAFGAGDFTGAANGDLFVSISDDGGLTWDAARGLTDSYGGPTGDPNGACDPAGAAGDCPSEHWMSAATFGTSYAVSLPTPSNVIDPSGSYGGSYFFDMAYIDDPEAGGAVFTYGAWYAADYRWVRVACVEPVSAPSIAMSPTEYSFPNYVKHCEFKDVDVTIENTGNATLTYSNALTEDPSAYSGWLTYTGFGGTVPSGTGNTETGQINLNPGGAICDPGVGTVVRLTGRVDFNTNIPSTETFEVDLVIADTVIFPVWDSVTTYCGIQLAVGSNGNMGNQGTGGLNMDYVDNGEWRPDDYDVYLYDGGQYVGWIDGVDTMANWGLFQTGLVDSVTLLPQGGQSHSTTAWGDIAESGDYTTNDTSITMTSKWYAPLDGAYECNFIIKETRITSNVGALTGLTFGEVIDWDVPGDSTGTNNSSGATSVGAYSAIYQQGIEMPGYDDSLEAADGGWDNDERFGATMYLGGVVLNGLGDTTKISDSPHGIYTVDNATYVYPHSLGLDAAELYTNMSNGGSSISDSIYDLHTGVSYVFEHDMAANDTLIFYTAYVTTLNSGARATTQASLESAKDFFIEYIALITTCCVNAGDVNCDDAVDISDLTYTVDFMFRGGPPPCCYSSADVNNDAATDISDLTYRVDFMFRGGPALVCGSID